MQNFYKDQVEFYFSAADECRNFWRACIDHHTFFRCPSAERARQLAQLCNKPAELNTMPGLINGGAYNAAGSAGLGCAGGGGNIAAAGGSLLSASLPSFTSLLSAKSAAAAQYVYVGRTQKELIEYVRLNFSKRPAFLRM